MTFRAKPRSVEGITVALQFNTLEQISGHFALVIAKVGADVVSYFKLFQVPISTVPDSGLLARLVV